MAYYSFEFASIFFMAAILICVLSRGSAPSSQNLRFIKLNVALLAADTIDVISAKVDIAMTAQRVPLGMLLTAADYIAVAFCCYFYATYVEGFLNGGQFYAGRMRRFNIALICVYAASLLFNFGGHFFFYYDETCQYTRGLLYPLLYLLPVYFIAYGLIRMLVHRQDMTIRQIIPVTAFSVFVCLAAAVQLFVAPAALITLFSASLCLIIIFFFLETPDYKILMDTMADLKKAEEVAQEERLKAYAANQAKSSFLANVSHEIRTPINAVLGMNEMILRETTEDNIKEYAMDVNSAGVSLLAIINDILDISKVEAGKMEIIPAEYELSNMINDLVNMTSVRAKSKGLDLNVSVDSSLPSVLYGDDLRLKQIIMNLLSNGVKYTKEGSVDFTVGGTVEGDILRLNVSVRDTGIGIKEEELQYLFTAFQRLDERANRNIEGTGLGMSIASELLRMMGSQMELESTYGQGSHFHFTVEQKIINVTPIGNIEETIKQKAKEYNHDITFTAPDSQILVVDDNSINRKVVSGLLKDIGCQIDEAGGGYECLDRVREKHYDLIFLDHLMPDLDGVWTLEKIKSEENLCMETPVIAFTANAVSGMKESFLATGFNGFISKPVDAGRLEEILLEFLPKDQIKEGTGPRKKQVGPADIKGLPDLDNFDFRYAAVCLGGADLIKSVAVEFNSQSDRIAKELEDYLAAGDMNNYRTSVHALKSTSRMLGEITLSGLCKTAEFAARAGESDKVQALQPMIMAELAAATEELQVFVPKQEITQKTMLGTDELAARLTELKRVIDDRDVNATDALAKELSQVEYNDDIAPLMQEVFDYIKLLKLLKASAKLEEILEVLNGKN